MVVIRLGDKLWEFYGSKN